MSSQPMLMCTILIVLQFKRIIGQRDSRLKKNQNANDVAMKQAKKKSDAVREMYVVSPTPHP